MNHEIELLLKTVPHNYPLHVKAGNILSSLCQKYQATLSQEETWAKKKIIVWQVKKLKTSTKNHKNLDSWRVKICFTLEGCLPGDPTTPEKEALAASACALGTQLGAARGTQPLC